VHLLCGLLVRLGAVRLKADLRCALPVRQAELSGALKVLDWSGSRSAGEFDPATLHLARKEAL
jgi:hypothetical protein